MNRHLFISFYTFNFIFLSFFSLEEDCFVINNINDKFIFVRVSTHIYCCHRINTRKDPLTLHREWWAIPGNMALLLQVDWKGLMNMPLEWQKRKIGIKIHHRIHAGISAVYLHLDALRFSTALHGGFGLVLWHINISWLFNAKCFLYIHIKYIWFDLVGFYGISTIVGYYIPNLFHTYMYIRYMSSKPML